MRIWASALCNTGSICSVLTPFINYVINDPGLNYLSSANEGDAVASAAGLGIGGKRAVAMMQNSGLGNAVRNEQGTPVYQ